MDRCRWDRALELQVWLYILCESHIPTEVWYNIRREDRVERALCYSWMGARYEHLRPITSSVTSVQMETRCTEVVADASLSLTVAWLGQDQGCSEEELVLLGTVCWAGGVSSFAHLTWKIRLHLAMSGMWKLQCARNTHHDHRASISRIHSHIVFTCFVCSHGPEAASRPAKLPGFQGASQCFGRLWQSRSWKSPLPALQPPACCHSLGKLFQVC